MHGGGSDLAAGLNHVMRAPRGSESLPEKIDFTPKGNGGLEGEGKEERQSKAEACFGCSLIYLQVWKRNHENPSPRSAYAKSRRASKNSPSPVYPAVLVCAPSQTDPSFKKQIYAAPIIHAFSLVI